jgi:tRNA-specific 2-thiouridylase
VDSAVTAALLKEQGADVTGVFIKGWYPPGMPCTWADDRRDAMRVAAHLQIPFLTLDASKEYKEGVIDYLLSEYRAGRTPNPDIMCNREVKFGAFHAFAKGEGATHIGTGHYAQTRDGRLFRGADEGKDQSYFLWAVPKEALEDTLFPLGGMHKEEVRRLAARYNLPNATKKDSQGVCFLGSISVDVFLRAEMRPEAGKAIGVNGAEVGTHDGSVLYTLGERIALHNAGPGPWYVVSKDLKANTVTVSHGRPVVGPSGSISLTDTNWFNAVPDGEVEAQYRYHGPRILGALANDEFTPRDPLPEPIASGQSLVLYRNNECVGGGIIAA